MAATSRRIYPELPGAAYDRIEAGLVELKALIAAARVAMAPPSNPAARAAAVERLEASFDALAYRVRAELH